RQFVMDVPSRPTPDTLLIVILMQDPKRDLYVCHWGNYEDRKATPVGLCGLFPGAPPEASPAHRAASGRLHKSSPVSKPVYMRLSLRRSALRARKSCPGGCIARRDWD